MRHTDTDRNNGTTYQAVPAATGTEPASAARVLPAPPRGPYVQVVKPLLDRVLALVLLLVLTPVILATMLTVWASLGRPILFHQVRVGQHGRRFTVYKLRTMQPDRRSGRDRRGRQRPGVPERRRVHKHPDDPRLTATGRFLRRWSLDELPQLVNVVRGDMSLVGPRPELPSIVAKHYEDWQHVRHLVKPGLTGLWQVSERGNGMMHEHIDVDLDYVEEISFLTDVRILLQTPVAALGPGKGH